MKKSKSTHVRVRIELFTPHSPITLDGEFEQLSVFQLFLFAAEIQRGLSPQEAFDKIYNAGKELKR